MIEPPKPYRLRPVVTIAALYGAGGSRIGTRVAEQLGVQFLDRAIPSSVAKRAGLPEQAVAEVEEPQSRWQRLLAVLGRASPPSSASGQVERLDLEERRLRAEIEDFLADASRSGGAIVLAEVHGALHVYLGGDRKARVERVMEWQGVDRETAAHNVKINDRARRDYVRSAYGVEGDDAQLYHLMVDAVALGVDVCVDLIVAASKSRGRRSTVEGRR
jgi:cytidylate kinase